MNEVQDGDCVNCGLKVVWKARLEGTDVKVVAQHVLPNLDCDKPYPKGDMVGGASDDTVYPPQIMYVGMMFAIPPGNDKFDAMGAFRDRIHEWGFVQAGFLTQNGVEKYQLPERVHDLQDVPEGSRYISINGPVMAKR